MIKSKAILMSKQILVFTDGSFIKHLNKCGYGVFFPNSEYKNISRRFKIEPLSNQRAELYAIYKAIKRVNKDNKLHDIKIFTDSEYSIKSLTLWIKTWKENNWIASTNKPVANQDIIKKIDNMMTKHTGKIEFKHVRSHTGKKDFESLNNEIVDKLAKLGGDK
jgi:ribonuclease HI